MKNFLSPVNQLQNRSVSVNDLSALWGNSDD